MFRELYLISEGTNLQRTGGQIQKKCLLYMNKFIISHSGQFMYSRSELGSFFIGTIMYMFDDGNVSISSDGMATVKKLSLLVENEDDYFE